ncbi:MAG: SH3 domain-containing protein [Treponema sp.]|nr:SH3 domain-containing protein [Spirochaetales bacterium]MDY6190378.1 SH3 domain-containing protein [Treponema sp.]
MKNFRCIIFLLSLFSLKLYADEVIHYITNENTEAYYYDEGLKSKSINKNYRFSKPKDILSFISYLEIKEKPIFVVLEYSSNRYRRIPLAYVNLDNCEITLPENIISYSKEGYIRKAIPSYLLDVLNSNDKESLRNFDCFSPNDFDLNHFYAASGGICEDSSSFAIISNIGIRLYNADEIDFMNIKKVSDSIYECESCLFSSHENEYYDIDIFQWRSNIKNSTPPNQSETIRLTIDGDYLIIDNITRNENITTLAYVTDSLIEELNNLFSIDKADLSRVIWPRHADGTCDYEKGKALVAASSSATNVSINKEMSVKENLKLRSAEATSSNVLTVMSAGTKVKILELGKVETIDGIKSNWVKVEIISGKDRDGNILKSGMAGWCYGGYLR